MTSRLWKEEDEQPTGEIEQYCQRCKDYKDDIDFETSASENCIPCQLEIEQIEK